MIKWDFQHTLVLVGTTLVGATLGYVEQQSATSLLDALQSWAAMKHMLVTIGLIDLSALVALAKQSFFVTPAGGAGNDNAGKPTDPASFPKKPAVMAICMALGIGNAACLAAVAPILDCTEAVIADAIKGMSVVAIVADVGQRCSMDAAAVMALLLAHADRVKGTGAFAESMRAHNAPVLPAQP